MDQKCSKLTKPMKMPSIILITDNLDTPLKFRDDIFRSDFRTIASNMTVLFFHLFS